jgi:SAM-dependent methyltransferase
MSIEAKQAVHDFWQRASCGEEAYALGGSSRERLEAQARTRYELEPYIRQFARFESGRGLDVLEVGVGMGADHLEWARHMPRSLSGIDLTERAIAHTATRLALYDLRSDLRVADAEKLPFRDASFDLVYSWGVLHHSPDTSRAVREVLRVLRPGGVARVMIYHAHSMLHAVVAVRVARWPAQALTRGCLRPPPRESPGTKAYSRAEARSMFSEFSQVDIRTMLSFGDLLEGAVGQRHGGPVLTLAKRLYPRAAIRRLLPRQGLTMLVEATR